MLETRSLSAAYGNVQALRDVTLQVSGGEILGLIGPNGAGKSTLIRVISGVLKATKGRVILDDQDITTFSPRQRALRVAVVPQARQLGGAFTVKQTVMLGRTPYLGMLGKANPRDEEIVQWAMAQTSVQDLAGRRLAEISGGEQQRVLLARALAQRTKVLLLDEPTNHLDLGYQVSFLNLFRELVEEQDLGVVMAMHDLNQVAGTADRVALLIEGRLHAVGDPHLVLTPDNIETAYNTPIDVLDHPTTGKPFIVPHAS